MEARAFGNPGCLQIWDDALPLEWPGIHGLVGEMIEHGFREVPHTADVALEVWAPDLSTLFAEAARGLNSISGITLSSARPVSRRVHLEELDDEALLVAFLTELVYAQEQDRLGFDAFRLKIEAHRLEGEMLGRPIAVLAKPIKAVTFHNLQITSNASGLSVLIVLDV